MSLQANSVNVTSLIFIVMPPRTSARTIPRSTRSGITGQRAGGAPSGPGPRAPTLFFDYMRIFLYKVSVASRTPGVRPPALQGRLLQGPRPSHPDPPPRGPARPRAERPGAPGGAGA